jgi:hypothetical protein
VAVAVAVAAAAVAIATGARVPRAEVPMPLLLLRPMIRSLAGSHQCFSAAVDGKKRARIATIVAAASGDLGATTWFEKKLSQNVK